MSLPTKKCPSCEVGKMFEHHHDALRTKSPTQGKRTVIVYDAWYWECNTCGERGYEAKEIKRWDKEFQELPEGVEE